MYNDLVKHKEQVLSIIQANCKNVKILGTEKGLNLIGTLKKPINVLDLMLLRLLCFDDVFRLKMDINKIYDRQLHRVNRIWSKKNDYKKPIIINGESIKVFNIKVFEQLLGILKIIKDNKNAERKLND